LVSSRMIILDETKLIENDHSSHPRVEPSTMLILDE